MSTQIQPLDKIAQGIMIESNQLRQDKKAIYPMTSLYLNKILYFLNAIHLVKDKSPLFSTKNASFQKWAYGPTIPDLYNRLESYKGETIPPKLTISALTQDVELSDLGDDGKFIEKYLPILMQFSPFELTFKACQEPQWIQADRKNFHQLSTTDLGKADYGNNRDYKIPAFTNGSANYNVLATRKYYAVKGHQFWLKPPKTTQKVVKELNDKKLGTQIKKIIISQAANEFVVTNFKKGTKSATFHGKRTDLGIDSDFEITYDPYNKFYVAMFQNAPVGENFYWYSRSLSKAIIGCSVLSNKLVCKLHNDYLELNKQQKKEIVTLNTSSSKRRIKWQNTYTKLLPALRVAGNFSLADDMGEEAKKLHRINKDDIYSTIMKSLKMTPTIKTQSNLKKTSNMSGVAQLQNMIGLQSIKKQMKIFIRSARVAKRMRQLGQDSKMSSLDMVFLGNPGTGKTQVARIVGKILNEAHITPKNKFKECSAKDLIAGYTGQTGHKTAKIIKSALGGVLFIDEAYILTPDPEEHDGGYRRIAISELIRQAENHRDDLVIILAGYTDKMEYMIKHGDPGLRSRFNHVLEFPDYTNKEMFEIFKLHAIQDQHCLISKDNYTKIKKALPKFIKFAKQQGDDSNGRLMRNLLQAIVEHRNYRIGNKVSQMSLKQINTISSADIQHGFKKEYHEEKMVGQNKEDKISHKAKKIAKNTENKINGAK